MDKENNMLERKIIQLIHSELDNIGGKNIFKNTWNDWATSPIYERSFKHMENIDFRENKYIATVKYSLRFEDGEPDIDITDNVDYEDKSEPYKIKWVWSKFRRKVLYTNYTTAKATTTINCGHVSFKLTAEEREILVEKTKTAFVKFQSLEKETKDIEVLSKIEDRLRVRRRQSK